MSGVIGRHFLEVVDDACSCEEMFYDSRLTRLQIKHEHSLHVEERLHAAGFGPVREAAAAALHSVDDIWGAGGRSIVRLSEIRESAVNVLDGGWDNHIQWNMGDIMRRKLRAEEAAK